ncbi:MAG TPA: glycosyltransferase [Chitinophagales bacterium]|nr:glycosyltransferase [Chitinophagales bacterium]
MKTKTALLCVLNWGLGHAARCLPIIKALEAQNVKVIIASDGDALAFLKKELPSNIFEELPSYNIQYPKDKNMMMAIGKQMPSLLLALVREQKATKVLAEIHQVDFIISDNRYGCYHNKIKSIFITHQLYPKMPDGASLLQNVVNKISANRIKKFSECWIPDFPNKTNLSGNLAHPPLPNCKYIGSLSRFSNLQNSSNKKYKVFALLSGPEPQRSILENILIKEFEESSFNSILVRGKFDNSIQNSSTKAKVVNYMNEKEIAQTLSESEYFICRGGYSTIMDLVTMQPDAKVVFIPTPGQTEQEYLAQKFASENLCVTMAQKKFSLSEALEKAEKVKSFKLENYILESSTLLSQALTSVITA